MKTLIKSSLIIILTSSTSLFAQLPDNISELVDQSAPAVVNISAMKEISQRSSFGYGGIPDEMLERFGIPRDFREMPQQRRESVSFGSGLFLKVTIFLPIFMLLKMQPKLLFLYQTGESIEQRLLALIHYQTLLY